MLKYFVTNETTTPLDALIDSVLHQMNTNGVDSEEYPKLLTYLERLYELKAKDRPQRVSRDTIALVLGNLAGIILIVTIEQTHPMTSKGFSQIIRPRGS